MLWTTDHAPLTNYRPTVWWEWWEFVRGCFLSGSQTNSRRWVQCNALAIYLAALNHTRNTDNPNSRLQNSVPSWPTLGRVLDTISSYNVSTTTTTTQSVEYCGKTEGLISMNKELLLSTITIVYYTAAVHTKACKVISSVANSTAELLINAVYV